MSRQTQPRRQPDRRTVLTAGGDQDSPNGGGSILTVDDVCMAWLMNALSQAPALTDEQLHRARRRLAQP